MSILSFKNLEPVSSEQDRVFREEEQDKVHCPIFALFLKDSLLQRRDSQMLKLVGCIKKLDCIEKLLVLI